MITLYLLLLMALGAAGAVCPRDCDCGLDSKGRRQVQCARGGMSGPLPVHAMDPYLEMSVQVLKITAPEDNKNTLTIGPMFQQFQHLEELHIVRSNLPAIGKHSFWGVPTLKYLNLTDNNITQVLDYNFRGLANLVELYLDHNNIESMASGTFHHLAELKVLSISHNRLRQLSPRLFLQLGKLKHLDLSHNYLENLDPTVFKDIQELRVFSCRFCGLKNMNPQIYSLLSGLTYLDLGNNQFKYLASDEFQDLKKLQVLKLDGNHFPVILEFTFATQTKLQRLSLAKNRLAKVTTHAFANLTSLIDLDLGSNKLTSLEPVTFQPSAETLKILNVSGNKFQLNDFAYVLHILRELKELTMTDMGISSSDLPLGLLTHLENLHFFNLSGNEFTSLPVQVLSPVHRLKELDLSRNKFHGLDENLVSRLETIPTVHFNGNPWACDLCHIGPMLARANSSYSFSRVICALPYNLKGRTLGSLEGTSELGWCGSGLGYRDEGFAGLALTHNTQLGLIAAGAAVALLVVTMFAVVAGLLYNRHHAAYYYTNEERRKKEEADAIYNIKNSDVKVSIATIDEITKDPDLQVLTPKDST